MQDFTLSDDTTVTPFPFRHNWQQSVIERVGYLSGILRGYSGFEQRFGLRARPRRTLEYRHQLESAARLSCEALINARHSSVFALPVWTDSQLLAIGAGVIGADEIAVNTAHRDFEAGGMVMLWQSESDFELHEIESVETDKVFITGVLDKTWTAGTRVIPCRKAALEANTNLPRATSDLLEFTAIWRLLPGQPSINRLAEIELDEYLGKPVYRPSHNWIENLQVSQSVTRETVDFEIGTWIDEPFDTVATNAVTIYQLLDTRESIAEFLGFLDECRGAQKSFWLYLPVRELQQTAYGDSVATDVNALHLDSTDYSRYLFDLPNRRHVAARFSDGTTHFQNVTGRYNDSETVFLLTPKVETVNPVLNYTFSFLRHCRFDANEIEIAWITNEAAQISTRFQELTTTPE